MEYTPVGSKRRVYFGILLGVVTLLIHWYAPASLIEELFSRGLFKLVRFLFDHTVAQVPIPFFYLLCIAVIYWVYRSVRLGRSAWRSKGMHLFKYLLGGLNFFGWLIFAFYWLWGFNYDRIQLQDRLPWEPASFDTTDFKQECLDVLHRLGNLRLSHSDAIDAALTSLNYQALEDELRLETSTLAKELGYETSDFLTCRSLKPRGILLRFSTAGFYNPFTGECNLDHGLHTLQKPFVMAHEFFHGLGVSGEGDCNLLAYITCFNAADPVVRYSAELGYWRYLRRNFYRTHPDLYEEEMKLLPAQVRLDLQAIEEAIQRYPDIAPKVRDAMYSAYLKSNKIEDGLANYSRIVTLVMQWRRHQQTRVLESEH